MDIYDEIQDNAILDYETSKIAVYEESKFMYLSRPYILKKWKDVAYNTSTDEILNKKPTEEMGSFAKLYEFVVSILINKKFFTKEDVRITVRNNRKQVEFTLKDNIEEEFAEYEENRSPNEDFVHEIIEDEVLFANMEPKIMYFKETLKDQEGWVPVPNVGHVKTIKDNKEKVIGVAKIDTKSQRIGNITTKEQQGVWEKFRMGPIETLGHDTTDVFVVLSHFLISNKAQTTEEGYTYFSSDDALKIMGRNKQKRPGKEEHELKYKEEDRFNIMQQVMNLDMTWVAFSEDSKELKIINGVPDENELYEFQDYVKLFEINRVNHAFDRRTGEYKGIYGVYIKPSEYLRPYLREFRNQKQFAAMSLKLVQYTSNKQPVAKNLGEFIAWMFKIASNTHKADIIAIQHKVSTLIKEAGLKSKKIASLRDSLERGLNLLEDDGIISGWDYKNFDKEIIGKPGYAQKWLNATITIDAPTEIIEINKTLATRHPSKLLDTDFDIIEREHRMTEGEISEQQSFPLYEDEQVEPGHIQPLDVTPQLLTNLRGELGLSIRKASGQIGVSAPTLSRFEKGSTELKQENKELLALWVNKHIHLLKTSV